MQETVDFIKAHEAVITPLLSVLGLILSVVAVVVSVRSAYFVRKYSGPLLKVRLRNSTGDLTDHNGVPTRYHHLTVENGRSWAPAKETIVHITRVERQRADGEWIAQFENSNPMPLVWQRRGIVRLTVERSLNCDIGYIQKDRGCFGITVDSKPHDLNLSVTKGNPIRITVEASAENGVSDPFVFEIAWDGHWEDGAIEMARHLILKPSAEFRADEIGHY